MVCLVISYVYYQVLIMDAGFNVPLTLDDPFHSNLDTRSQYYLYYCKYCSIDIYRNLELT